MKYATIVDVRTPGEYLEGNVPGSINIPLQDIVSREAEVMELEQPVLFCCASGNRSGQATVYFKSRGFECENGGGWMEVNARLDTAE